MIKKLAKNIGEFKKQVILTPLLVIGEVLLEVFIIYLMSQLVDNGIEKGDLAYSTRLSGIMLGMAFLSLVCGALAGKFSAEASAGFSKNLRKKMFTNIQAFSFKNTDKFSSASLITRLTTDVQDIQMAFQVIIRMLVRAPVMLILATTMATRIHAKLALVFFLLLPILAASLTFIVFKAHPVFKTLFKKMDKLNLDVEENLTNIRTVKSYVRGDYEIDKFEATSREVRDFSVKAEKYMVFIMPTFMMCIYIAMLAVSWFGGKFIISGLMTEGDFMSFLGYIMMIFMSFMMVGMASAMIVLSRAAAERVVEVIDEKSEITSPEKGLKDMSDGSVSFKNVSFSYKGDVSNLVLQNINLDIKSGETVGIIGGTGSAKSTLVQLIPRLYDVTEGELDVGGADVRSYDLTALRDNIAMVLQKNLLFSGTIADNLRWGDERATADEIRHVAEQAQAASFIEGFEDGYETELGQAGVNISGGQKQRLCIARALLKNPKILILDDSTSAVDVKTNALINNSLKKSYPDTTKIIIAQRVASISDADKIVVLHDGRINGVGTHDELMETNEIYREVYTSQVKGAQA